MPNITTSQGPSAHNQTSNDHSLDSNQAARQPKTRDVLKAEGMDNMVDIEVTDITFPQIKGEVMKIKGELKTCRVRRDAR